MVRKYGFILTLLLAMVALSGGYIFARHRQYPTVLSENSETSKQNNFEPADLENTADGYRLKYPSGWKTRYYDSGLHLSPPNARGELVIKLTSEGLAIEKDTENTTPEENEILKIAEEMIKSSFEQTHKDKEEGQEEIINERFRDL